MLCEQQLSRIFITSIRRPAMPIISIKTNCTLDTVQQQQLLKQVVVVTSETLAVEKERIDVSLQILPSELTITGGVQKRLFVRYTVAMLAGRTLEMRRALVKSYQQTTLDLISEDGVDVKTILQDLRRDQLALAIGRASCTERGYAAEAVGSRL